MSKVPFVDLSRQNNQVKDELVSSFLRVLEDNSYILGKEAEKFEREFSEFVGVKHTIACANGTDALVLSLLAHGIGQGDEVVTVSNTFFATVEAIVSVGAKPILVDVREEDALIDSTKVESAISARTKAIIPVHLYGQPVDLDSLAEIAQRHAIPVIEDAAQAHGAQYKGKTIGSISSLTSFSFYPGKNLGALGDAGAVTTNDDSLAEKLKLLRDHGRSEKYAHSEFGWNMRADGMQSAFLSAKLKKLAQWNKDRANVADLYRTQLADLSGIRLLSVRADVVHANHLFVVICEDREWLKKELQKLDVDAGVHYPIGCHQQPAWTTRFEPYELPVTEKLASSCLSLPIFGAMTLAEADRVVAALREILT